MNTKKIMSAIVLIAFAIVGCLSVEASIIATKPDVVRGAWSSDLDGGKAAALRDNVPLLVFWGNTGCSHCQALENAMNERAFTDWMAKNKIYMVFKEADLTVRSWILGIAKENGRRISAYPFAVVYWPKNASGNQVLEAFSAYKGNMGEFGADSRQNNVTQFITALDSLLAGWDPSGETPVDPVDPVHVHQWSNWSVTKAATCTTAGERRRTCSGVDCPNPVETQVVNALGHDWGAWTVVTPAAVGVAGVKQRTCKRCGEVETGVIPAVDPDPEHEEVDLAKVYKRTTKFEAVAYNGGDLFGKVDVSIGKYNARSHKVRLTVKISSFEGKTYTKSVSVVPNKFGGFEDVAMRFKNPVGDMLVNIEYNDGEFAISGEADEYQIENGDVTIGGVLDAEEMSFSIEMDELEPENEAYDFLFGALPSGVMATIRKGTSFSFGSSPKIKYVKFKEDGEKWYELAEFDEDRYPNVNAVKLTYKAATGVFTGTFKVYASNEDSIDFGKKPKLKTYSGKFNGMVIDGVGIGTASIKIGRRTYVGSCSLD